MKNEKTFDKILASLRICIGVFLALFGIIGILVGIVAILDPVGSKMSDDGDPFGIPPTLSESLTLTFVFISIFVSGVCLTLNPKSLIQKFSKLKLK